MSRTILKPAKPEGAPLVHARWVSLKGLLVAQGYNAQEVNAHFGTGNPTVTTDVQLAQLIRSFLA